MSVKTGLAPETIVLAHDIVCSMMGSPWIEEQNKERGGAQHSIALSHPLYTALNGSTEESVLTVLHLAAYLQAFRNDPGFGKVIASLRNADSYHPTIIELDLAWKFRNAGSNVCLFPITPNGVADFAAPVNGVEHVVEVSSFPSDSLRDANIAFLSAMANTFASAVKRSKLTVPLSLELDLEDIGGSARQATIKAVKELAQEFRVSGSLNRLEKEFDFGTIAMRPTIEGEGPTVDRWTAATRFGRSPIAKSKMLGDTNYTIQGPGSWVYLHDRTQDADPYVRLRNKLKSEARQVSGCADAVIILEIEALGVDVINDRVKLQPVIDEFARQHQSTTGIAIVVRTVRDDGRQRGVSGHYFPLASSALPAAFWDAVEAEDEKRNLLDELRNVGRRLDGEMDKRAEGLKTWGSTGAEVPDLAGQYTLPPGDNGDRDRRMLLADILTILYNAVGSAQRADVHPDPTINAVHQLVISNSALVASESDAFLALVSRGLEAPAQIHQRSVGEMTRRVLLCRERRDLALELYNSAEPSWRKLGAKILPAETAPEFAKGERDMRTLENTDAFRKAKADIIEKFHVLNDTESEMFSKRSHGDIYALVQVSQALQRRDADVRRAINQALPAGVAVNVMIDRTIGFALTCLTSIVAEFEIDTGGNLKRVFEAYQAMQQRDQETGALGVPPSA